MLIDELMPQWDVREQHRVRIRAPADRVYAALRQADLGGHPMVRALLGLRALPAALRNGRSGLRELARRGAGPITLSAFEQRGFRVLADDPPHEIVIGLEGAFWKPRGDLREVDASTFRRPVGRGVARGAWNFAIAPDAGGACLLTTETRVATGPGAALPFRLYWLLIRPGSGLIRRLMLRAVRAQAERARV